MSLLTFAKLAWTLGVVAWFVLRLPFQRKAVSQMLEEYRNRPDEDRQDLTSGGQWHSQCNTGTNALMTDDNQNSRDHGCQRSIRRHSCTDVHPAQCKHLQCTTKNNTRCNIA